MTPKERAAGLLLAELTAGASETWFYVSMVHTPTETFRGGFFVPGKGPTDAWFRFHGLNLCEKDCETVTHGPIDDETMNKVPKEMRYRKLSREEVKSLGRT